MKGVNRVLRGGSWNNAPINVRSANRNRNEPANRNDNVGFRLASTMQWPDVCCLWIAHPCIRIVQPCYACADSIG
ncbi:MAG: hypothetical protein D3923_01630 [Candidatus Electrothrix sp. AR3]|nr:hypothetical protein [Candidatus Electrothrix sp. AR3]